MNVQKYCESDFCNANLNLLINKKVTNITQFVKLSRQPSYIIANKQEDKKQPPSAVACHIYHLQQLLQRILFNLQINGKFNKILINPIQTTRTTHHSIATTQDSIHATAKCNQQQHQHLVLSSLSPMFVWIKAGCSFHPLPLALHASSKVVSTPPMPK